MTFKLSITLTISWIGLLIVPFGPGLAQGLNHDKSIERVVDLCKEDPNACDFAYMRARDLNNWRAAPLCKLDPCACDKCDELTQNGNFRFESGNVTLSLPSRIENLTRFNGTDLILRSPTPAFDGLFNDDTGSLLPTGTISAFRIDRAGLEQAAEHDKKTSLLCNSSGDRPAEYWRELMLRQRETEECSAAADLVLDQRNELGSRYLQVLTGQRTRDEEKSAFSIFENYRKLCLHPLADLKMTKSLGALLGANFVPDVKRSVGELHRPGVPVLCTASIAHRSSGEVGLVTAAHCIGEVTRGAGDGRLQYAENFADLTFTAFDGKKFAVHVDEDIIGYDYPESQDAVFIPTTGAVELPSGFAIGNAPDLWAPLYVVGVNPFLRALAKATNEPSNGLFGAASLSLEPGCRVYGISGRGLVHNCQTEKSMSGSPILEAKNGIVTLVAVQSGEAATQTIPECPPPTAAAANLGTMLNP